MNPRDVHLVGVVSYLSSIRAPLPRIDIPNASWSNLSLLEFKDCDSIGLAEWSCLQEGRREVTIRLARRSGPEITLRLVLWIALLWLGRVEKVVVCAASEESCLEMIRRFDAIVDERVELEAEVARGKGMVSFEVE